MPPKLTAPMATALLGRRPTIMVSTMAMLIQPSSARTSGMARRRVGRTSARRICMRDGIGFCSSSLLSGAGGWQIWLGMTDLLIARNGIWFQRAGKILWLRFFASRCAAQDDDVLVG